jgi:hypothetical protein
MTFVSVVETGEAFAKRQGHYGPGASELLPW